MKLYKIECKVGMQTFGKVIQAENIDDAREKAAYYAAGKSEGGKKYLHSYSAKAYKPA